TGLSPHAWRILMPMTRRAVLGLIVTVPAVSAIAKNRSAARAQVPNPSVLDVQFASPPDGLSDADLVRLAQAVEAARGASASQLVCDVRFLSLHPQPAFRDLVRGIAREPNLCIAREDEPGVRIFVRGRIVDKSGDLVGGAIAYAYHTSAKGWYAA